MIVIAVVVEAFKVILGRISGRVEIRGADCTMMRSWMVFRKIIGPVGGTTTPVDVKLTLADAITDPIETHIDGFGAFLFYRVVGDAGGCSVVSDEDRGRLRMA
jgi:hypothetical protein